MTLKLVIGNKNYSSWSMRPWLALRANNIAFEEIFIPLYTGDADKQRILDVTHSGKVPALIDGDITVWDSLAIIEYARRTVSGGAAVARGSRRPRACAFDFGGDAFGLHGAAQRMRHEPASAGRRVALSADARANIARIQQIWIECRARYGKSGPFLFGAFGGADAMFAPVVHRFRTYAIEVEPEARPTWRR